MLAVLQADVCYTNMQYRTTSLQSSEQVLAVDEQKRIPDASIDNSIVSWVQRLLTNGKAL